VSKDLRGNVSKMLSFSPRLAGIPDESIPHALPAHMGKLLQLMKDLRE
jgi:hypothetical protein